MQRKSPLVPFIAIVLFFLLLNNYVLNGLQTLFITNLKPIFWSTIALLLLAFAYAVLRVSKNGMDLFFKWISHVFLILFVSEVLFVLVLLLGDIYRPFAGLINYLNNNQFLIPARNQYWLSFGLTLGLITVLLFLYGILKGKYAYRVIKHQLFFTDLPQAFDGFTITQISDVHAGSFANPKAVQKGIDLINAQQSDLFVFTGDLVNNKAEEIEPWIGHFSQIKAPFGQFSVLGNHDYGDYVKWESQEAKTQNLQQLKLQHQNLGFRLLLDEHIELQKDGETMVLAGIENWGIGFGERGDLKKALQNVSDEEFKILLSHDPSHWEAQVKNYPSNIHLTLAGHTHGMQFGIEAFGIKWSPVKYRYKHWAGIKKENGSVLNINRGFGFLGYSGRIGIWPEITVIELKKELN